MRLFPKFALLFNGLSAATVLSASAFFYITERHHLLKQSQAMQEKRLGALAHIAAQAYLDQDDLLLIRYAQLLRRDHPAILSIEVTGPAGKILAHTIPSLIGKEASRRPAQDEVFLLQTPVRVGGNPVGHATIALSQAAVRREIDLQLAGLRRRMAAVSGVVMMGGMGLAFRVARSFVRPLKALAAGASRIAKGEWGIRVALARRDEIGQLAEAFNQMAENLGALDRMKEDFTSAVTHELRSPLGAIESYLNLMADERRKGVPADAWDHYLDRMKANTARLSQFITDLLDVAALERGKVRLDLQPMELAPLCQEVVDLFMFKAQERSQTLAAILPERLPWVMADRERIRQVLINLISNGLKFTPDGGAVAVAAEEVSDMACIEVSDTGFGVSEEDQKRIFDKFEQGTGGRQRIKGPKGTGLGLAIAKALVEMHGGVIGVRSAPNRGSTFYFTLPLAIDEVKTQIVAD